MKIVDTEVTAAVVQLPNGEAWHLRLVAPTMIQECPEENHFIWYRMTLDGWAVVWGERIKELEAEYQKAINQ